MKTKIPYASWMLVCDGAKALVLRNEGNSELLNLIPVDIALEPHPSAHDLGTDRPGRVYQSQGTSRSEMEETDWHQQAEDMFLSTVAEKMDALVQQHGVTKVVLVAPPRALGVLRQKLSSTTREMISAEVAKDLTKLPILEIERYFSQ